MSDPFKPTKGIRTFAADFARVKESTKLDKDTKLKPAVSEVPTQIEKSAPTPTPPPAALKAVAVENSKESAPQTTPPESKTVPTTAKKIPAFHELQKAVASIDVSDTTNKPMDTNAPTSIRNKDGIEASRPVGGGTIITDTKQPPRPKSPGLFSGISKWITSLTAEKKKAAPKLAIPETSRRKGVIQQATTKTGTIFTSDSETLKERIKARELRDKAITETKDPETTWSPYTDTGYNLLESGKTIDTPSTQPNEQVESNQNITTELEVPAPEIVINPEPDTSKPLIDEAPVVDDTRWIESSLMFEPTQETTQTNVVPIPKAPAPITNEESEPEQIVPVFGSTTTNRVTTSNSNKRNLIIVAVVALTIVLLAALGWGAYQYLNTTPAIVTTPAVELSTANEVLVTVDQSFTAQSLINTARSSTVPDAEYILQNVDGELLPAALAFRFVTPAVPNILQQYITDVRFVSIDQSRPQILVQFTDQISVQGALFANEANLPAAFAPLFGTQEQGQFIDQTIEGIDTRILRTTDGTLGITYGFTDDQTLLIAGTPNEFRSVLQMKK